MELASSLEESNLTGSQRSMGAYSNYSTEVYDTHNKFVEEQAAGPSQPKKFRGTIHVVNEKLVAALDKCKISDRDAVHIIIATAQALQVDVNSLVVNRTSIRRCREQLREEKAKKIRALFNKKDLNQIVLHWDGKMLPNKAKHEVLDRLPVVITNATEEQLLGVPELEDSTGFSQANAIFEVLDDWGLLDKIKALCCDTTPSNLGAVNGSAVRLEQLLHKDILFFPCRHHIYALVLRSVFEAKIPSVTGPNVLMFKRFQGAWNQLDKTIGFDDENQTTVLSGHIDSIHSFVEDELKNKHPRDDYKELLELTNIFIGMVPLDKIKFRYPGAFHHARWMSKAIYTLKIYLFREQIQLTANEKKALSEICLFIVIIYVRAWFTAPHAPQAPNHDLQFLKKLYGYRLIDPKVSEVTLKKMRNHLWYLNAEIAAMSFFDEELPIDVKRKMISQIFVIDESNDHCKRIQMNLDDMEHLQVKNIDHFVNSHSLKFLERFQINQEFLKKDPSLWAQEETYQEGLNIVQYLKVVNDTAERAVSLMEGYNNILTNNDDQKQCIMQIISEYRKQYPDSTKKTVTKQFV